jgi:hypothetical protein
MISAYEKGDTSLAFSIVIKVYYAVQTLHADLDIQQDPITTSLQSINCEESLQSIINHAKSKDWQENFQQIMT